MNPSSRALARPLLVGLLSTSLLGCSCDLIGLDAAEPRLVGGAGSIDPDDGPGGNLGGSENRGGGGGGGAGGSFAGSGGDTSRAGTSFGGATLTAEHDWGAVRRLTNYEYDNTLRDLFGTLSRPGATLVSDQNWGGFDNSVEGQITTPAHYEKYFAAASSVVDDVFADADLRSRVLGCTPAASTVGCARTVAETLGTRVWRRPLDESEIQGSIELFEQAVAIGETPEDAIKHMIRGWLSSLQFLYRLEFDPEPDNQTPRALNGYELASKLSYLLWSSLPDDVLFDAASQGRLVTNEPTDELVAQLERLLADPKSQAFVEHYGGQWLGMNYLPSHAVDTTVFPAWTETLRDTMLREGYNYLNEFLRNDLPLDHFFTHDVNFANTELAAHYGFAPVGANLTRIEETNDLRRGFLGLGVFLTSSSHATRTSPTWRGSKVLRLLCTDPPPPPPVAAPIDPLVEANPSADTSNIRARLEQHLNDPSCAACHVLIDPYGFGMESFDGIGAFRTNYSGGDPIDASASLPDGTAWSDFTGMTDVLAADPRFFQCATQRLYQYAQGRKPLLEELPFVQAIHDAALSRGGTLEALLQQVVLSEPFRYRHASAEPFEIPPSYL